MDIIEARAKKRMTQWDLRLLTGIHQSKISLVENGYVEPTDKEKAMIAKALGFTADEIEWTNPRKDIG